MAEAKKADKKGGEKGGEAEKPVAPIIIKKIQGEEAAGHGGAWKIALADMMTAMMAFFLLMWLLGATTEAQRKGIADYFKPTPKSRIQMGQLAGSNGVLGGRSILDPEGLPNAAMQTSLLDLQQPEDTEGGKDRTKGGETGQNDARMPGTDPNAENTGGTKGKDKESAESGGGKGEDQNLNEEQKQKIAAELEQKNFEQLENEIREKLKSDTALKQLEGQVRFIRDKEGLRIEIIDKADFSMFGVGTNKLLPRAQQLIDEIAKSVATMPNKVTVRGHTDSLPFANPEQKNNWTLSAERAESTRQLLERRGVPPERFARIEGVADTDPFNMADPRDPRNRRISITLKYPDQQ
jgi:chemotaxis protein MotB